MILGSVFSLVKVSWGEREEPTLDVGTIVAGREGKMAKQHGNLV